MSATRLSLIVALTTSLCVSGCAGFEPLAPPPNEILTLRNPSLTAAAAAAPEAVALPLPILSRGQQVPVTRNQVPEADGNSTLAVPGTVELADQSTLPYSAGGKLTFNKAGASSYCTGNLIGNSGVLLTAAHCLWDLNGSIWSDRLAFGHKYDRGAATWYDWECAAIYSNWTRGGYGFDYAFIRLRGAPPQGIGFSIRNETGLIDSIGYPAGYFGGERMVQVIGNASDGSIRSHSPNPMKNGSSGGAWLDSRGYATSVNSFGYDHQPTIMYGPGFDYSALQLFEYVQRGCTNEVGLFAVAGGYFSQTRLPIVTLFDAYGPASARPGLPAHFIGRSSAPFAQQVFAYVAGDEPASAPRLLMLAVPSGVRQFLIPCIQPCAATSRARLMHSVRSDLLLPADIARFAGPTATFGMADVIQAVGRQCEAACADPANRLCLRTGAETRPLMRQLDSFAGNVHALDAAGPGSVIAQSRWEAQLGIQHSENVCYRGEVRRTGDMATNSGLSCLSRARSGTSSFDFITELSLPNTLRGRIGSGASQNAMLFEDASFSPTVAFTGTNAAPYQQRFGGNVLSTKRHTINGASRLMVTTASGCISGPL